MTANQLAIVFEQKDIDRYEAITLKGKDRSLECLIKKLGMDSMHFNKAYEFFYVHKDGSHKPVTNQAEFEVMSNNYKKPFLHIFCYTKTNGASTETEQLKRTIYFMEQEMDQLKQRNSTYKQYVIELEQRCKVLEHQMRQVKQSHNNMFVCDPPEMDVAMNFVIRVKKRFIKNPDKFKLFVRYAQLQERDNLLGLLEGHPDLQKVLDHYLNFSKRQRERFNNTQSPVKTEQVEGAKEEESMQDDEVVVSSSTTSEVHYPSSSEDNYKMSNGGSEVHYSNGSQLQSDPQGVEEILVKLGYTDEKLNKHLIQTFLGDLNAIIKVLQSYYDFSQKQ